jgi:hypothetical protein
MARTSATLFAVLSLGLLLSGCDDTQADYAGDVPVRSPPWVKTVRVELSNASVWVCRAWFGHRQRCRCPFRLAVALRRVR